MAKQSTLARLLTEEQAERQAVRNAEKQEETGRAKAKKQDFLALFCQIEPLLGGIRPELDTYSLRWRVEPPPGFIIEPQGSGGYRVIDSRDSKERNHPSHYVSLSQEKDGGVHVTIRLESLKPDKPFHRSYFDAIEMSMGRICLLRRTARGVREQLILTPALGRKAAAYLHETAEE